MAIKKPETPEERAKRIENFKRALPQIEEARKKIEARKKQETPMGFFRISKEEDKNLEHMTVRALADAPEGSHTHFDTHAAYITIDGVLVETKDFVIAEEPPLAYTSTTWSELLGGDPPVPMSLGDLD
jgi:beta-galactosidase beta subunit